MGALTRIPMRAARWSARHPWRAIMAWVALVVVAVGLALAVPTQETTSADYRLGESGRADALVEEAGLEEPDSESVLVTATPDGAGDGGLDEAAAERAAAEVAAAMRGTAGVARVADPLWSADREAVLVPVELEDGVEDVAALQEVTRRVQADHPGLAVRQAGAVSIDAAIGERVEQDLRAAEGISVPVTLALMLLAFGALVAAGIPVLLAVTSVTATIGLMAPLSHLVHAEPTVTSMIVLIGMAVGVDYSLFYLKREREERAAGRTTRDAVEIAARTSGHSVLVSGGAVVASMAGLFVVGDATFSSLAVGAILVVAVAVLGSITVLPALLVTLGRWVDRPRVPGLWRLNRRIGRGGISARVLGPVLRHPRAALVVSGVVVVALAVPTLTMRTHNATLETLPGSIPEVQTITAVERHFPGDVGARADVVVQASPTERPAVEAALAELADDAEATGDFVVGAEATRVSTDGSTSVLALGLPYDGADERVDVALRSLRAELVPVALDGVAGAEHAVGGDAAEGLDFSEHQDGRLPIVVGFILLLTLLIMGGTFRSVVLAGVSTLLNVASVGVAFGVLTLVFQEGWGSELLDFTSPGFVIDWIPLFVLVVLVGLSMDYHVFVLSRVREHVVRGLPTRLAVERGIADTAGVVTSAAAVMVSVFAIFATLSMLEMKMMGVGLAVAILLDATLIRLVMLPAALVLLGERAWWPGRPQTPRAEVVTEPEPAYAARLVSPSGGPGAVTSLR